jgi:hypothetical protein
MTEGLNILLTFIESAELIFIFAQNTSLTLLLALVVLIGGSLAVIFSVLAYKQRMEKQALTAHETLPEIGSMFGTNVAVEQFGNAIASANVALRFTRHGTDFNAQILRAPENEFENAQTEYKVEFRLTKLREQFHIYRKSVSANFSSDWQPVSISGMPDDFIFFSSKPLFLAALISDGKIRTEIFKYPKDVSRKFEISFADGVFIISEIWSSEDDWETEAERIEQVCRTAVVFHEVLREKQFSQKIGD